MVIPGIGLAIMSILLLFLETDAPGVASFFGLVFGVGLAWGGIALFRSVETKNQEKE